MAVNTLQVKKNSGTRVREMNEPRAVAGKMQDTLKASFSENKNKGMSKRHTSQLSNNASHWVSLGQSAGLL